jgi:hypothetical protein
MKYSAVSFTGFSRTNMHPGPELRALFNAPESRQDNRGDSVSSASEVRISSNPSNRGITRSVMMTSGDQVEFLKSLLSICGSCYVESLGREKRVKSFRTSSSSSTIKTRPSGETRDLLAPSLLSLTLSFAIDFAGREPAAS